MNKEQIIATSYVQTLELIEQYKQYKITEAQLSSTHDENQKIALTTSLQQISDSMKFDNPVIWIMYKHRAYENSDHPILTVGSFRAHCSGHGDICSKRYAYLRQYLIQTQNIDLHTFLDPKTPLESLYTNDLIVNTLHDSNFMKDWHAHEYYIENGKVSKWKDYTKTDEDTCPCCN